MPMLTDTGNGFAAVQVAELAHRGENHSLRLRWLASAVLPAARRQNGRLPVRLTERLRAGGAAGSASPTR